uniref:ABC transporter domain-containing protein n=2 Tax=Bursaphelenchus xylophilus TaxID=6326 RepID=A0A1I7SH55_BURXY
MERQRVAGLSDDQQALATRSLFKFFPPKKCAVQNLTFGMAPNECFGLLGVNGAGKTTTFDMLTNKILPTSGTAKILGIPIQNTPAIGYCPQFDALSDNLTGRETLQLLGRLNGFQNVDERVKLVLECVLLEKKANSLVKTYSGGQKRRLSIAACLMSGSKFLILDEPTAGVDPATRRHIWDLLIAMRNQNKAILLTTHSMEECEALCTRIGFLRAGRLRGIGTSQHLKSRYGNSFILTLILNFPSRENAAFIDDAVRRRFDVSSTDSSPEHSALSWTLPKKEGSIWSEMYAVVEDFVDRVNRESGVEVIHDFYLIQDSLEQVFTRLANSEEDLPDENQEEPLQNAPRNSTLLRNERRTTLDSLKF